MNSRNISAMLLSCKEKANTRKLHLKQQPLLSRVDMGWEPRRIGGGVGGLREPGEEERKRGSQRIKGKARYGRQEVRITLVQKI